MDDFQKQQKKFLAHLTYASCNIETKHYLQKLSLQNVYCFGNIKLISEIDINKIKNLNENFYNLEDFGLQLVPTEVKIFFVSKLIKK